MAYQINLDISPFRTTKAGVQLFLNWLPRADDENICEPAMVFMKAGSLKEHRRIVPLPLSAMYKYVESNGYGVAGGIVRASMAISQALGFSPMDSFASRTIADLILEYSQDLIGMPTEPWGYLAQREAEGPKGELSFRVDGQTVLETEVAV